jgi:hypothetical protein
LVGGAQNDDGMSGEPDTSISQRIVRPVVWGAVVGAIIATFITLDVAGSRSTQTAWSSRLSYDEVLAIGRWVGLPVGAFVGAVVGGLVAPSLGRRWAQPRARSDEWKLRWISRGIGLIEVIWLLASFRLFGVHSFELRVIVGTLGGVGVFFLSWSVAWLCGIRPFGG